MTGTFGASFEPNTQSFLLMTGTEQQWRLIAFAVMLSFVGEHAPNHVRQFKFSANCGQKQDGDRL
jgi:hypothetical protein